MFEDPSRDAFKEPAADALVPGGDVLLDVERPPEVPLLYRLWKEAGAPVACDFRPHAQRSWLRGVSTKPGGLTPEYRLWLVGAQSGLLVDHDGMALVVQSEQPWAGGRDQDVEVFPHLFRVRGMRGHAATAERFMVGILEDGARRLAAPECDVVPRGDLPLKGPVVRPQHRASPEARAVFLEDLRVSVESRLPGLRAEMALNRARNIWPAELCREELLRRDAQKIIQTLLDDLALWMSRNRGAPVEIALCLSRPHRISAVPGIEICEMSRVHGRFMPVEDRAQAVAFAALTRAFPSGWLRRVGPERAGALAQTALSKIRGHSERYQSRHAQMSALARLGAG